MKRAITLSVDGYLPLQAKTLNINLSRALEDASYRPVRHKQAKQWKKDNADALRSFDDHVEKHGVFSDRLRSF